MWFQVIEAGVRVPLYSCIVVMDLALHLGQMTGLCMQTELQQLHFLLTARMLSLGRMTQPHAYGILCLEMKWSRLSEVILTRFFQ